MKIRPVESVTLSLTDGELTVGGDLTIDSLSRALGHLSALTGRIERVSFDASGRLDSAAVIFLIKCQKRTDSRLVLTAVPDQLCRLLNLYGLGDLFLRSP
jgi:ABC-type transporter Mla MlaB component